MMKENKKSIWVYIIFFGSIWGILEATLGYALHFLPALIAGSVMFPIGATLMMMTLNQTKSKEAMILVAAVAAAIKAVNFFMPGLPIIRIYHPMIAIMLQSLVIYVVAPWMQGKPFMAKVGGITIASISWRVLFVINLVINTALTGNINGQLESSSTLISFILYSGLVDAAILTAFTGIRELASKKMEWKFSPSLLLSLSTFVFAVVVTIVF